MQVTLHTQEGGALSIPTLPHLGKLGEVLRDGALAVGAGSPRRQRPLLIRRQATAMVGAEDVAARLDLRGRLVADECAAVADELHGEIA